MHMHGTELKLISFIYIRMLFEKHFIHFQCIHLPLMPLIQIKKKPLWYVYMWISNLYPYDI